ncbi:MAG: peptide chain release factor 1 [Acidocella sp.]|nr:peptide chain release factor 1 [Acidocella sp.]
MKQSEYTSKLDEFDYLMNDPEAEPAPERVWEVLAALSFHELSRSSTTAD